MQARRARRLHRTQRRSRMQDHRRVTGLRTGGHVLEARRVRVREHRQAHDRELRVQHDPEQRGGLVREQQAEHVLARRVERVREQRVHGLGQLGAIAPAPTPAIAVERRADLRRVEALQ